jgi:hypothetical protein
VNPGRNAKCKTGNAKCKMEDPFILHFALFARYDLMARFLPKARLPPEPSCPGRRRGSAAFFPPPAPRGGIAFHSRRI